VSVRELPPVASSYRQLQVCRIEHLDFETRNEIEITHGFPLCVCTAFVQRSRSMPNEHKDQLLVTDESVEVQDLRKITDISIYTRKSKDGT
jgi:hypothetical protein